MRAEGDDADHTGRVQRRGHVGGQAPDQGQLALVGVAGAGFADLLGLVGRQGRDVDELAGDVAGLGAARDERGVGPDPGQQALLGLERPELALQGIVGRAPVRPGISRS